MMIKATEVGCCKQSTIKVKVKQAQSEGVKAKRESRMFRFATFLPKNFGNSAGTTRPTHDFCRYFSTSHELGLTLTSPLDTTLHGLPGHV